MKESAFNPEAPDIQDKMLEVFFAETAGALDDGIGDIRGDELKKQFIDFFRQSGETKFERRLVDAYTLFDSWLVNDERINMQDSAPIRMPLLKIIRKHTNKIAQQKKLPASVYNFPKK